MLRFKPITKPRSPLRAAELHHLARTGELNAVNPQTTERYATWTNAVKNVGRLVTRSDLYAYVIHEDRGTSPIGIATIMPWQTLIYPSGKRHMVNDLDYTLLHSASSETHEEAALGVIEQSAKRLLWDTKWDAFLEAPYGGDTQVHDYCATIDPSNPSANRGFGMLPLERVEAEYLMGETDIDRLAKGGAALTYLVGSEVVSSRSLTQIPHVPSS